MSFNRQITRIFTDSQKSSVEICVNLWTCNISGLSMIRIILEFQ